MNEMALLVCTVVSAIVSSIKNCSSPFVSGRKVRTCESSESLLIQTSSKDILKKGLITYSIKEGTNREIKTTERTHDVQKEPTENEFQFFF